jgi:hypothetical protein
LLKVLAIVVGNLGVNASNHFFVESGHVVCSEGRLHGDWLVENAAEGPDVGLAVVWLVLPHFWWGVVGGSCLCVEETLLGDLAYVHVAQFCWTIPVEKDISRLEVSVQDLCVMERLKALNDLNKELPDFVFSDVGLFFLMALDFLE